MTTREISLKVERNTNTKMLESINNQIQDLRESGKVSDGYHTFEELYNHRVALFIALAKAHKEKAWIAYANADGSKWDGWFILGIFPEEGKQITYHLPETYLPKLEFIKTRYEINPHFDGHKSEDILERLLSQ